MKRFQARGRRDWKAALLVIAVAVIGIAIGTALRLSVLQSAAVSAPPPVTAGADLQAARGKASGLRVLFVANSFTDSNAMPSMVKQLAGSNPEMPRRVFAVSYAPGGSHLADAAQNPALLSLLSTVHWNVVVLQEQSQVPALPYWLVHQSLPAVQRLTRVIRRDGALPVLFETWGYRVGDRHNFPADSYPAMQSRLRAGYAYLARHAHIAVVPVGETWSLALAQRPASPLWDTDGHHPSLEGSYLTAAALNAAFDLLDPQGTHVAHPALSTFTAGLDANTAAWLREIAYRSVRRALVSATGRRGSSWRG